MMQIAGDVTMPMAYKPEASVEMPDKRLQMQGLSDVGLGRKASGEPTASHPLERMLVTGGRREEQQEMTAKALVFGQHAPLRTKMERELLSQFQRLPGLPSSLVGLETFMDTDETIEFEDIFNLDQNAPMPRSIGPNRGLHDVMEQRLSMRY
mmetsp:Transcript_85918/g.170540  ORF Transcript_85918/g.170540 Transcript_85918/m.170540 type:complete len:152 (+) Transcript_85918:56-511(+)